MPDLTRKAGVFWQNISHPGYSIGDPSPPFDPGPSITLPYDALDYESDDYWHKGYKSFWWDMARAIVNVVYYIAEGIVDMLNLLPTDLWWDFPSGHSIKFWDHSTGLVDFRMYQRKFTGIYFDFFGLIKSWFWFNDSNWKDFCKTIHDDTELDPTGDWYYRETWLSGDRKQGKDYDPPRTYSWSYDLPEDVIGEAAIIAIILIAWKLGGFTGIARAISYIYHWWWNDRQFNDVKKTEAESTEVAKNVEIIMQSYPTLSQEIQSDHVSIQTMMKEVQDQQGLLQKLQSVIGLKLSL